MPDKIHNIRKFLDIVMVELYDRKQKGVWEQITLEMIEKQSGLHQSKYQYEK